MFSLLLILLIAAFIGVFVRSDGAFGQAFSKRGAYAPLRAFSWGAAALVGFVILVRVAVVGLPSLGIAATFGLAVALLIAGALAAIGESRALAAVGGGIAGSSFIVLGLAGRVIG